MRMHSGLRASSSKISVFTTACSSTPSASLDARVPPCGSHAYRCGSNATFSARSTRIAIVTGCLTTPGILRQPPADGPAVLEEGDGRPRARVPADVRPDRAVPERADAHGVAAARGDLRAPDRKSVV